MLSLKAASLGDGLWSNRILMYPGRPQTSSLPLKALEMKAQSGQWQQHLECALARATGVSMVNDLLIGMKLRGWHRRLKKKLPKIFSGP